MEAYTKAKEADPEFYRDASSLQYGKVFALSIWNNLLWEKIFGYETCSKTTTIITFIKQGLLFGVGLVPFSTDIL